jgi:hypothetical protein
MPPCDSFSTEPLEVMGSAGFFVVCVKRSAHTAEKVNIDRGVESHNLDGDQTSIVFASIHIRETSSIIRECGYILKARDDHRPGEAALEATRLAQKVQKFRFLSRIYHVRSQHLLPPISLGVMVGMVSGLPCLVLQ